MTKIKQITTDLYDISYDPGKNRIYYTMKGFCPSTDEVPSLSNQWRQLCEAARTNFSILEDFSTLKTLPDEVYKLVVKLHLQLIKLDLYKIAIILPKKSDALNQIKDITKLAILPFATFESVRGAESWLNDQTQNIRKSSTFFV